MFTEHVVVSQIGCQRSVACGILPAHFWANGACYVGADTGRRDPLHCLRNVSAHVELFQNQRLLSSTLSVSTDGATLCGTTSHVASLRILFLPVFHVLEISLYPR